MDALENQMRNHHLAPPVAKTVSPSVAKPLSPPKRHVFDRLSAPKIVALPGASRDILTLIRKADGGAADGASAEGVFTLTREAVEDEVEISSEEEEGASGDMEEGTSGDMEEDEDEDYE